MVPTYQNVKFLSATQRREIEAGQEEDIIVPDEKGRKRVWTGLVNLGIATSYAPGLFSLKPGWKVFDLNGKPKKERGHYETKTRCALPEKLKGFSPDPPKGKISRPTPEYSNCATGNALIDKILKSK